MHIKKYLKEPYPYYYSDQKRLLLFLVFISVLSFCFSFFFEPFVVNVAEHKIGSIWILVIHASIPFPIAYIYFYILSALHKDETSWTLGKEIFSLSILLLIIGISDFLIRDIIYTNPDNWSFHYFWEEIRNTFLVGFLLLALVLPLNLERLIKKHTATLKKLAIGTLDNPSNSTLLIKTFITNEHIELKIEAFLFAKVESNYTEIITKSTSGFHKVLVRITLKELEEQLKSFSFVYKTHRSYLVNLNHIKSISGNAQGYYLFLKNYDTPVPVSRSNIEEFNSLYSKM